MAIPTPTEDPRSIPTNALASVRDIALFLGLTFGFAWALWGYLIIAMPPGGLVISPAFIVCAIVGGFAPSLAAIVIAALRGGSAGVGGLLATILRPVRMPYLLLAVLAVPFATAVACGVQLLLAVRLHWPDPSLLAMAAIWPIMAALGEEFGWRTYLTARLVPTLGLLTTALLVGLIWGLWHLPADFVALKGYGGLFWLAFLINGPIVLTAHAVILTWLWQRTGGSTLSAIIYHWSVTASAIIAPSAAGEGWPGLMSTSIGAAAMWAIAGGILFLGRKKTRLSSGVV